MNSENTWCKGCFLNRPHIYLKKYLDRHPITLVSGIGCTGRITHFLKNKKQNIHTLHGRACAVAAGISRFEKAIVFSGDGDLLDIGLSHLIHAKERNDNMRVICMCNDVYAMTGRQKRMDKHVTDFLTTDFALVTDTLLEERMTRFLDDDGFGLLIIDFKCIKVK